MHVRRGAIAARCAEARLVFGGGTAAERGALDGVARPREGQFHILIARDKGDMPAGGTQEVAQGLEEDRMRGLYFSPLMQGDVRRDDAVIEIGAQHKKIEAVAIYDELNVVRVAERSAGPC